jgi:hypothetical protein
VKHVRFRAFAFTPGAAPAEIQLWNIGDNPTDYGVHRWTDRSCREVGGSYAARGNPLQIDVEHNGSGSAVEKKKTDEPAKTGGYARLDLRGGAPWLVFDWSAYAVEQIASRQRLFLSPEYDVDPDTGEITSLIRVSLVGDPGTHHARMLAAAKSRTLAGRTRMDPILLAALMAAKDSADPKAALEALLKALADAAAPVVDPATGPLPETATALVTDDVKKPVTTAAEEPKKDPLCAGALGPVKASAVSASELALANRIAQLEATANQRAADDRYTASASRIPTSLEAFARTLAASDPKGFDDFVKGLPVGLGPKVEGGIKASASRTVGDRSGRPEGDLPAEDKQHMDRIFASHHAPEKPVVDTASGGVRASHLYRPGVKPMAQIKKEA